MAAKKQIPLRLSEKLYADIAAWAEDDFRSVNGQIEYLLSECVRQRKKDGKYGFVDKNGNVVVEYIYDDAKEQNSSGFAAVKKDGKWGTINSKGETTVAPTLTLENNPVIDFIGTWHLAEDANANYYTK